MGGFGDALIAQNTNQMGVNDIATAPVMPPTTLANSVAAYGGNPSNAAAAGAGSAQNANLPSPQQADALLAAGAIAPHQHAAILNMHGLGAIQNQLGANAAAVGQDTAQHIESIGQTTSDQQQAVAMKAADDIKKAQEAAAYDAEHQKQMAEYEKQQAAESEKLQQEYTDRRAHVDRLVSDASSAHVDPEAARGSIGQRALAGIAMALGAMGSAYTGGPNMAAQIIQRTIEDNLQSQKDNLENKWRTAGAAKSDLADVRDQIKDHAAADNIFRAREAQKQIDYLKGLDLQHAAPQVQAGAAQMMADLEQKKEQWSHDASLRGLQNQRETLGQQAEIAVKRTGLDIEAQKLAIDLAIKAGKPVSKEVRDKVAEHESLMAQLDELEKLKGLALPGSDRSHEAEAKLATIQAQLREHYKIGERHPEMVRAILGSDITGIRSGKASTQIATLRKNLTTELNSMLRANDIDVPEPTKAPGKAGAGE
jgi:hypothetical protein